MDKYEARRQSLIRLVNSMGRGGRVAVAKAIDKTPDYVSRMLYPFDKRGFKRIGEHTADQLTRAFPTWQAEFDAGEGALRVAEPQSNYGGPVWPFATVTYEEWLRIPYPARAMLEQQIKALVPSVANTRRVA